MGKKLLMWLSALMAAVCLLSLQAFAREIDNTYVETIYNEQNGLPTGEANVVLQTGEGYIWIGSYGGLIRYDGSRFRNFSQERALASSSVRSLYEDAQGRLWIGTNDAGIYVYDQGAFKKIPCTQENSYLCIRGFAQNAAGEIYAASTSGMGVIRDGKLEPCQDEEVAGQTVYSVAADRYGRIWGVMNGGNCAVLKDNRLLEVLPSRSFFEEDEIYCVTGDREGQIFLGTNGNALAKVSFSGEALEPASFSITHYQVGEVTTHNQISITENGDLMVAGLHGAARLTPEGELTEFGEDMHASSLNAATMDYEGNIWLASSSYGVIKYTEGCYTSPNTAAGLAGTAINAVAVGDDMYYLGVDQGLLCFDRDWKPVENQLTKALEGTRVRHVIQDSQGWIWTADYSTGVYCYAPESGKLLHYDKAAGLISDQGRVLLELQDGSIAVGTQEGLSIIGSDGTVESYGADWTASKAILCLAQGADGTLYAGSDGGGIYAVKDGKTENYGFDQGLDEGVVLRILEDGENSFFVSAGSNLYYWEKGAFRKLENFHREAGSIFDLYDRDEKLWLLQNSGVLAVDKKQLLAGEEAWTQFHDFGHGLTGSLNANLGNCLTEDGSLYIATRSGVSVFYFETVDSKLPMSVINSIQVDETVYEHPESLKIPQGAQRITVDFSMLTYSGVSDGQMSYYLEGFDQTETLLTEGISGTVSYTNLPGGSYTFHLKVFDPEDPENFRSYSVAIQKDKVFYELPVFWVGMAVLALALMFLGAWWYQRHKILRLRRRQKEYREIIEQSLSTFANAIDAKDPYTNGHSIRVAWYSREIARRMGASDDEQERIYYLAMLHDIGKIGIPDAILKKQGKLTDEEREVMQSHPTVGGEILKDFTALEGISEGARYHHERYDGKGYCTHKAGKDIPLVARIIGVADSYDAMSTDRCYRKALSREIITEELQKGSGTQFDPKIQAVMQEMIADGTAPVQLSGEEK